MNPLKIFFSFFWGGGKISEDTRRGNRRRGHLPEPGYEEKKGKCTPCISRGTISRSSLESRIRFLPSSMLAIPALWSPPGIAAAGTPDTPPANVPIPVTFVGIVAVCECFFFFVSFRILFYWFFFSFSFSHVRSIFPILWFFFFDIFGTQIFRFFTAAYTEFPVRRRTSTTSVSVSAFPRHFPIETFFRVC